MGKLYKKFQNENPVLIKEECSLQQFNKLRIEAAKRLQRIDINDFALISGVMKNGKAVMFYID